MLSNQPLLRAATALALGGLFLAASLSNAVDEPYEKLPIDLPTTDFLAKSQLTGDGYTIAARVSNDGVLNTYTVQTGYGELSVTGTDELLARLQEIKATRALQELEDSEEFKEAAKGAATGLVDTGKALWDEPGETTRAAAKGIGQWMRNVGSAIKTDDPHQDGAMKTVIGYDAVKRRYAIELGVDPYTDFEPFQVNLNEVAKAAAAGGMVTSFAINLGTAGGLAGVVVDATSLAKMKGVLQDNPPVSLARINQQKLLDIGIAEYQAEALLKNYNYTPSEMTLICEALIQMGEVDGREIFVAFATSAPDREVAHFVHHYAQMLAAYIRQVESGDIVDINGSAWMLSDSKTLVGAFPMDYLAWTPGLSEFVTGASEKADALGATNKKILLKGRFSPGAHTALEKRGWKLSENVNYSAVKS
jgi:hypothetical protein